MNEEKRQIALVEAEIMELEEQLRTETCGEVKDAIRGLITVTIESKNILITSFRSVPIPGSIYISNTPFNCYCPCLGTNEEFIVIIATIIKCCAVCIQNEFSLDFYFYTLRALNMS